MAFTVFSAKLTLGAKPDKAMFVMVLMSFVLYQLVATLAHRRNTSGLPMGQVIEAVLGYSRQLKEGSLLPVNVFVND